MKSSTEMATLGKTALAIVAREGELLGPEERKPKYFISPRAKDFWHKLSTWYGASKMEDFGDYPPSEVCKAVDALAHRDDMAHVLCSIKDTHQAWPPTTPQLEALIRKHVAPPIDWTKLRERLTEHVVATRWAGMSRPQRIGIPRWLWYQDGVFVPPGEGAEGFFVGFSELPQ